MQRVIRTVEDAEHGESLLLVHVVEDVVVVDGEVVAAADALQQRGSRGVGVVGERDDGLPDVAQRALRDGLQLAVGAVGDVEAGRHHVAWGVLAARSAFLRAACTAAAAKLRIWRGFVVICFSSGPAMGPGGRFGCWGGGG